MDKYRTEKGFAVLDALKTMGEKRGKSISQMALAWILTQPFVTAPIVGASNVTQLEESVGAIGERLTEAEMQQLDDNTGVSRDYGMHN